MSDEKTGETEEEFDHDDGERTNRLLVEAAADLQEDAGTPSSRQTGPRIGPETFPSSRDGILSNKAVSVDRYFGRSISQ